MSQLNYNITMTRFRLQKAHLESIKHHIDSYPEVEVCGLLGGIWEPYDRLAVVQSVQPVDNIDEQPHIRFTMDPQRQTQIILDFEQQNWEVVGIYHSHPQGYARPSATDIAELTYPDAVYLIGVPQGELTAWRIIKGTVQPVLIEVIT